MSRGTLSDRASSLASLQSIPQKAAHHSEEAITLLDEREMAAAIKHHELGTGNALEQSLAMADWQDPVVAADHDKGGRIGDLVEARQ